MGHPVKIRTETSDDEIAIHRLTAAAFADMPYGDGSEPRIVDALRNSGDLMLSLVAEHEGVIVGHVAFSPVIIDREPNWVGLGPVSVAPDLQRQGIGTALIEKGLRWIRAGGARGCVLVGDPAYYCRFGFESDGLLAYGGVDRKLVQRIVYDGTVPRGTVVYAPAFVQ